MSAAEERRHRARQQRELARTLRQQDRERLRALKAALRAARDGRKERVRELRALCRAEKARLREKVRRLRAELADTRAELRSRRTSCGTEIASATTTGRASVAEAHERFERERTEQRKVRETERAWKRDKRKAAPSAAERRRDSDDTVRNDIPEELVPVWERVKASIRESDRRSRTEAFLEWVHNHSSAVEQMMNEAHAEALAKLEAQERALAREMKRAARYSPRRSVKALSDDLGAIPF